MSVKKIAAIVVALGMAALVVGAASAQQAQAPERPGIAMARALVEMVADETGLEPKDILAQLRDGMTLADIIVANSGDVDAVIDEAVAKATETINAAVAEGKIKQERADKLLSNLESVITRGINGELSPGAANRPLRDRARAAAARNLIDAAAEATGLEAGEILRQAREGSTLGEIIEANGGSVETVVADAVASATERINGLVAEGKLTQEQADEMIGSLETIYTDMLNGKLPPRADRPNPVERIVGRGVLRAAAKQTGLDAKAILEQLKAGSSLADVLTANGVDVNAFIDGVVAQAEARIDEAVANGRLTQERADEILATLRERLTERINTAPSTNSGV